MPLKFSFEILSSSYNRQSNWIHTIKWLSLFLFFALLLIFSIQRVKATLDDLENKLREQEPIQIRWDDVDGPPFWVFGPQPDYDRRLGFHIINLNAHDPVTIRLTQEAYLRIHDPSQTLTSSDVEVFVSNGSGLYVEQSLVASGKDLILNPLNFGDTLVKVKLKSETPSKTTDTGVR